MRVILLLTAFCISASAQRELIEWNEFYELSWEDFEGEPTAESRGDAGTVVKIKAKPFYVGDDLEYSVNAYFNRRESWKRDVSASLLRHEKVHFDIAELYARKIRKKIKSLKSTGVNDVKSINKEIQKLLHESNSYDELYDLETLHGSLSKKQQAWETRIESELASLHNYRKTKRVIRIQ